MLQHNVAWCNQDGAFELPDQAQSFFRACHCRMIGSQIIEDAFNEQKNAKPWQNRRGTMEGGLCHFDRGFVHCGQARFRGGASASSCRGPRFDVGPRSV